MKEEEKLREINSLSEQTSSGDGSSAESCMLESEYERLEKEGKIKNRVYVCGLGWMLPTVTVYGCGCGCGCGEEGCGCGEEGCGCGEDAPCPTCGKFKDYCICNEGCGCGEEGCGCGNIHITPDNGTGVDNGNGGHGGGGEIPHKNNVTISENAYGISNFTINLLQNLKGYSGNIHITSGTRTPEKQAQIMLTNIKKTSAEAQREIYKSPGDSVIDAYNPNLSDEENLQNMIDEIYRQGPSNVSKHCSDFNIFNVIDVSKSSLSNVELFKTALKANEHIVHEKTLDENNCIHFIIRQPQNN